MKWYQWFLVFVAWTGVVFVAGHFLWPARELVEIPGAVVLDSAATHALSLKLDSVHSELTLARVSLTRDRTALRKARDLYADLARRLDSLQDFPDDSTHGSGMLYGTIFVPDSVMDWPAARYDTTVQHVTPLEITIGDSVERREVLQEIRLAGEYVLPPFNVFRNVSLHVTPSTIYYSRELPGKTVEKVEVIRWPWLPVVAGYVGGTIVTTLIAFLIAGASH